MTTEMARVIRPIPITPDSLVSTNVPENDHPAWAPGAYAKDAWVMHKHRVWQATKETSKEPGAADAGADWLDGGATNLYRMFDAKIGTQTVRSGGIEVVLNVDEFADSVNLLNLYANAIRVTGTDAVEGQVYEREVEALDAGAADWWEYFFEPVTRISDVVLDDLPPYAGIEIKVEVIMPEGEEARIGALGIGSKFDIGCARWGSSVSIRDFSIKEQDEWGNYYVQERDFSKRPEFDLIIDTDRVDIVLSELAKLRAVPAVYIAHSKFTSTIAQGFYRELMVVLSGPNVSEATLTIEATT